MYKYLNIYISKYKYINVKCSSKMYIFSVLKSIFENKFVSKDLKRRLQVAGKKGSRSPGSCDVFKCHHHLLPQQYNWGHFQGFWSILKSNQICVCGTIFYIIFKLFLSYLEISKYCWFIYQTCFIKLLSLRTMVS